MTRVSNIARMSIPKSALILFVLFMLVALHWIRPSTSDLWLKTLLDASHIAVFGTIAISLYLATPKQWLRGRRIGVSLAVATLLGFVSEAVQIPAERDASIRDFLANSLGAAGFLAIAMAMPIIGLSGTWRRTISAGTGLILLIVGLYPLITVSAAYIERNRKFPILVAFDSSLMRTFALEQDSAIAAEPEHADLLSLRKVSLHSGARPGIVIHDIRPDWRDFTTLVINLGLDEPEPLQVNIRIHDRQHMKSDQHFDDRFNDTFFDQFRSSN